jgi:hypothetical protein
MRRTTRVARKVYRYKAALLDCDCELELAGGLVEASVGVGKDGPAESGWVRNSPVVPSEGVTKDASEDDITIAGRSG